MGNFKNPLHYVRGTEMIIPSCSTDLEDGNDGGAKRGQFYTQTLKGFFLRRGRGREGDECSLS